MTQPSESSQSIAAEKKTTARAAEAALARVERTAYTTQDSDPIELQPCDVSTVRDPNHRSRAWVTFTELTLADGVDKSALIHGWTKASVAADWTYDKKTSQEPDENGVGIALVRRGSTAVEFTTNAGHLVQIRASSRCMLTDGD